jgi:hypothetical protein
VMPDDPLTALPVALFMKEFFEPRLLQRVLKGERFGAGSISPTLNRVQPEVRITNIVALPGPAAMVEVEVEARGKRQRYAQSGKVVSTAAHDLRLFRNGQLVGFIPGKLAEADGQPWRHRFVVPLPAIQDGMQFSAYALNDARVKSQTAYRTHTPAAAPAPATRRAYLLNIGVNAYDNPRLNLRYAANDADSLRQAMESRLTRLGAFSEVVAIALVSRETVAKGGAAGAASKANIRTALALLAGRSVSEAERAAIPNGALLRKATPDDLVFISFSGHGYYETGDDFYLLPSDIGVTRERQPTPAVLKASISSAELGSWLQDIDGGDMVLVIDACHSGAAVGADFKPGPMGSRGLGQLAFDKGMLVLAATQADNVALEAEEFEHGFLSYALVQEGLTDGRADYRPKDARIAMSEWLAFAAQRVPALAAEVEQGTLVKTGARGLKLVKRAVDGNAPAAEDTVQRPTLFEFAHPVSGRELIVQ